MNERKTGVRKFWQGKLFRVILSLVVAVFVLCVGAYFFLNSDIFLRRIVIPQLAAKIDAEVSIETLRISPLSGFEVDGIELEFADGGVAMVERLTVDYRFLPFLFGSFDVSRVLVESAALSKTVPSAVEGEENIRLKFDDVQCSLDGLRPGNVARFVLTARAAVDRGADLSVSNANVKTVMELRLEDEPRLYPARVDMTTSIDSVRGHVAGNTLDGMTAEISTNMQSDSADMVMLKMFAAKILDGDIELLDFNASGAMNIVEKKMDIDYEMVGPDHHLLNTFGSVFNGWSFGRVAARVDGRISYEGADKLQAQGNVSFADLQLRNSRRGVDRAPLMAGDIVYDLELDNAAKSARLNRVEVDVRQFNAQPLLDIRLDAPATITWAPGKGGQQASSQARANVKISNFDMTLLNLASSEASRAVNLRNGFLSLDTDVIWDVDRIRMTGVSNVENLAFTAGARDFQNLTIGKEFEASIASDMSKAESHAKAKVSYENKLLCETQSDVEFNLQDKTGSVTMELNKVNKDIFDLFSDPATRKVLVESFDASGRMQSRFDLSRKVYDVNARLELDNFVAFNAATGVVPPLQTSLVLDAKMADDVLNIDSLTVMAKNAFAVSVQAKMHGTIVLPSIASGSELTVASQSLDVEALQSLGSTLQALVAPPIAGAKPIETATPIEAAVPPKQVADSSIQPDVAEKPRAPRSLKVGLDLNDVMYRKVLIERVTGTVHVGDEQVEVGDVLARIQDGEVRVDGTLDLPGVGKDEDGGVALTAVVKKLAIKPFAESFASAEFARQVQAVVRSAELDLHSSSLQPERIATAAVAKLNAQFDVLSIQQVEWLDKLANGLGVDELRTMVFNDGRIDAELENGVLGLPGMLLTGPQVRLNSYGQAQIGGDMKVKTKLAFAGRVLEKIARGELGQQMIRVPDTEYRQLPAELEISGPLTAPEVKVAEFLKNLVVNTGREALREKLREKTKLGDGEIEAGLQMLEGLLGGNGDSGGGEGEGKETRAVEEDKPKQKPGINLLRGLINEATK